MNSGFCHIMWLMANFDTAGKLSGFTPFEHIFIVKTRLNHAQLRGLPAVSTLVNTACLLEYRLLA